MLRGGMVIFMAECDSGLLAACLHWDDGLCYFLGSDVVPCGHVCANYCSFDAALRRRVNRRLRRRRRPRVSKGEPVTKYHLDMAFSQTRVKEKHEVQGTLGVVW